MPGHFIYTFEDALPRTGYEQKWECYQGKPLLSEVVTEARQAIATAEAFQALPERNQKLVLDMASFAVEQANGKGMFDKWRENFWGLYVVGSRARGKARPDSDLDLLSAGTFYRAQGFSNRYELGASVFEGFELEIPEDLPSEYNVGLVARKYVARAKPTAEGVLPVDLNVIDLTFTEATLDSFKETMDVAQDGSQLPRIPLFEFTVPKEPTPPLVW